MKRIPIVDIGSNFIAASEQLHQLSIVLMSQQQQELQDQQSTTTAQAILKESSIKLFSSSETMKLAGNQLTGNIQQDKNKSGRSFLKGGM
jgi:hypothetical protein